METQSTRWNILHPFTVIFLLMLVLTTLFTTIRSGNASQEKESDVNRNSRYEIDIANIPPIDTAVPAVVKTASFGLG